MKKSAKIIIAVLCILIIGAVAAYFVNKMVFVPQNDYLGAIALYESGEYTQARAAFEKLGDYKDAAEYLNKCDIAMDTDKKLDEQYNYALKLMKNKKYNEAISALAGMEDYKDSAAIVEKCKKLYIEEKYEKKYKEATALLKKAEFDAAKAKFEKLGNYKDSKQKYDECDHLKAKWGRVKYSGADVHFVDVGAAKYNELWRITLSGIKSATGYEVMLVDDAGKKSSVKTFWGSANAYYFYEAGAFFPKSIAVRAFKESSEGSETIYGKWQKFDINYESISEPPVISEQEESEITSNSNDISDLYKALFKIPEQKQAKTAKQKSAG